MIARPDTIFLQIKKPHIYTQGLDYFNLVYISRLGSTIGEIVFFSA